MSSVKLMTKLLKKPSLQFISHATYISKASPRIQTLLVFILWIWPLGSETVQRFIFLVRHTTHTRLVPRHSSGRMMKLVRHCAFAEPENKLESWTRNETRSPSLRKQKRMQGSLGTSPEAQDDERACGYLLTARIYCSPGFLFSKDSLETM